jgi:hypothetical protein
VEKLFQLEIFSQNIGMRFVLSRKSRVITITNNYQWFSSDYQGPNSVTSDPRTMLGARAAVSV